MKFHVGPWVLPISKPRAVTISILVVSYLLITSIEVFDDPVFNQQGEIDIQLTSIDQNSTYSVVRIPCTSENWYNVINTTQHENGHFRHIQLPRYEYDYIICNVSVEPLENPINVSFFAGGDVLERTINTTSELSIEFNLTRLKENMNDWLFGTTPSISPIEELLVHSLQVWVYSSIPLVPVVFDVQTTEGERFTGNPFLYNLQRFYFQLYLTKDLNKTYNDILFPYSENYTLYLRPGSLNGTAYWDDTYSSEPLYLNVTYSHDEKVLMTIKILTIRLDLNMQPKYPLQRIIISTYGDDIYDFYSSPDLTPDYVYLPPCRYFFLTVRLYVMEFRNHYPNRVIASSQSEIHLNSSYNLRVNFSFNEQLIGGVARVSDIVVGILSLSVLAFVLFRFYLLIPGSDNKIRKDFRLIPIIALLLISCFPWFYSTKVLDYWGQEFTVTIESLSFGPIPIIGYWTKGSPIVWTINSQASVWSIASILLYWAPLFWSLVRYSTPSSKQNDISMGFVLFLPLLLVLDIYAGLVGLFDTSIYIIPVIMIICLTPILWLLLVSILSLKGKYISQGGYNLLERDMTDMAPVEKSVGPTSDEDTLYKKLASDISSVKGLVLLISLILLYSLPCARSKTLYLNLSALWLVNYAYDWHQIGIGALLLCVPYVIGGLFTIFALWRYMRRDVSFVWVPFGAILSYLLMLPGSIIIHQFSTWTQFTPLPIAVGLFVLFSVIIWFYQAYEEAAESEIAETYSTHPEDPEQE